MSRITFKRSILASAVLLATQTANAALYQVMEVTPSTGQSYGSAWGVAINQVQAQIAVLIIRLSVV